MRHYLPLLLLICTFIPKTLLGQDRPKPKLLDSLTYALSHVTNDTTKGWLLLEWAETKKSGTKTENDIGNDIAKQCYQFAQKALLNQTDQASIKSLQRLLAKVSKLLVNTYNWYAPNDDLITYFEACITYNETIENYDLQCECMRDLGRHYMVTGHLEKGRVYYDSVMHIERKNGDSVGLATSLSSLGDIYYRNGNMSEAKKNIEKAIKINANTENYIANTTLLNQMGLIYYSEGNYSEATNYYFEALTIADSLNDYRRKATSLHNLSNVYLRQKNYQKSLDFAYKALAICQDHEFKYGEAMIYNSLAAAYSKLEMPNSSIINYTNSLNIMYEFDRMHEIAKLKLNLSKLYIKVDSLDKAESFYHDIISIANTVKNQNLISGAHLGLGALYFGRKKIKLALIHTKKGYQLLKEVDDIYALREAELLLSDIYKKQNQWKKALFHYESYVKLNDSITNIDTQREVIEKEASYQIKHHKDSSALALLIKENEIHQQEKDIQQLNHQQRMKNITIFVFIVGVLFVSIIISLWFRIYKRNKRLKEAQMQKEIVLKMAEIESLQSSLNNQSEQLTPINDRLLDISINNYLENPLSKRELDVLEELIRGHDNLKIAKNLFISVNTVRTHLSRIYEKLEVKNRLQAVSTANSIRIKSQEKNDSNFDLS